MNRKVSKATKRAAATSRAELVTPTDALVPLNEHQAKPQRIGINSLAATSAELGATSVAREMRKGWIRQALYLIERQHLSTEQAIAVAARQSTPLRELVERMMLGNVENIVWADLYSIFEKEPGEAERLWQLMQDEARNEFESGHRAAEAFESTEWQRNPWMRARYIAIREGFIEQWQPRGSVELAMLDTLVQAFLMQQFWLEKHNQLATTPAMPMLSKTEKEHAEKWKGEWIPERVSEQEAIEFTAAMADRWNRVFLRTLRGLRDLRRYSPPVTINNPRQVNIATDGGQQVNVQRVKKADKRRPAKGKATTPQKRKLLRKGQSPSAAHLVVG